MSNDAEEKIQSELASQERLLWSGMPQQGLRLQAFDVFLIPFSLMWCGFAVFWEVSAVSEHAPFFFRLWGIPFVLFGVYIMIGRFFVDSFQRSRTWYGVTDQRVVLITNWRNRSVKTLALKGLNDISLSERSDGIGTITFGASPWMFYGWFGPWWPGMSGRLPPSFGVIPEARKVYELIREAQRHESVSHVGARGAPTGLPGLDSRRV